MARVMRLVGDKEGKGSKVMAMGTRVAGKDCVGNNLGDGNGDKGGGLHHCCWHWGLTAARILEKLTRRALL
jgi:hypothetical protein